MLPLLSQFLIKSAVRSPLYILNPPVLISDTVQYPKYSVIHYLESKTHEHFPTRDLLYFNHVPSNKRIPIFHILDLLYKDDTTSLLNRTLSLDVKKWNAHHIKEFKSVNLLETPNDDVNTVAMYNYCPLIDLYKYKPSTVSQRRMYNNLYKTHWAYVKEAINADTISQHFVKINIPIAIPNYNIINIIIKFNEIKFSRIVTDEQLAQIIDIYKWLLNETRESSTLNGITDQHSKRIMIELVYKGYTTIFPLSVLREMSEESELESKTKLDKKKVQRLFIVMLFKIQDKIDGILTELENSSTGDNGSGGNTVNLQENKEPPSEFNIEMSTPEFPDNIILKETSLGTLQKKASLPPIKKSNEVDAPPVLQPLQDIDNFAELTESSLTDMLNSELLKDEDNTVDDIFEESLRKVDEMEDTVETEHLKVNTDPDHIESILKDKTLDDKLDAYIAEVVKFKLLSSQELRTLKKTRENRTKLVSPYSPIPIDTYKQVTSEDTAIPPNSGKLDIPGGFIADSMKEDILTTVDRQYMDKVLHKDIVACITNLEKAKIIVKDYTIEDVSSALGQYELHRLVLKPLHSKESTLYFRIPKLNANGEMMISGIKTKMRRQRSELPIRKIGPDRVSLTSNYGKLFMFRSERKALDNYNYLVTYIQNSYLDTNGIITSLKPLNTYNNLLPLPNVYSYLSKYFDTISTKEYTFSFNYSKIEEYIKPELHTELHNKNLVFIGYNGDRNVLVMDKNSNIINYSNSETLGDMYDLLGIDYSKVPKPMTMLNVLGEPIPLGVIMGYYIGISDLIAVTGVKYEILESNKQVKLAKNQTVLKFSDTKLVITSDDPVQLLLFNGFNFYKNILKEHPLASFDNKEVYLPLVEDRNISLMHLKELNMLESLFLDPITIDVLKSMNEPTDFLKLLLRGNDLLRDLNHPDINDMNYSRIRGYDRIPGLMYRAITESVRAYGFKNSAKGKIELDPYKVWNYITQDNTVKIAEDNNPITNLKEMEAVTLTGMDGLNKDATPIMLRRFHKNDTGVISESTVEGGDVALNIYLTPYARFNNVRGTVDKDATNQLKDKAKIFSTSSLLVPGVETDDPKRINFIGVQNGHTIATIGYQQPILRTGYEYIVPYRVGPLYCSIAKMDGVVTELTDKLIVVKYTDNSSESIRIGTQYGRMEGATYSHNLVTDLKLNQKFKKNEYLAYNTEFFERDWLDDSKLILKFGKVTTVALAMTSEVYEDTSAISEVLSKELSTTVIKEKSFVLEFNKNIVGLVKEGEAVTPTTVLFTLLDENTDYGNLSESSIEMLQTLAALSPKAKVNGVIDRYEIRYNGEVSDMSPSLKKLAMKADKELYESSKGTDHEIENGRVTGEYRVAGKNLNIDTLELRVYIRTTATQSIGDKGVFGAQMKSVISSVYTNTITTESGDRVDALFSLNGILNRVVNSPILMGTTIRLCKHVSKQVADAYFT